MGPRRSHSHPLSLVLSISVIANGCSNFSNHFLVSRCWRLSRAGVAFNGSSTLFKLTEPVKHLCTTHCIFTVCLLQYLKRFCCGFSDFKTKLDTNVLFGTFTHHKNRYDINTRVTSATYYSQLIKCSHLQLVSQVAKTCTNMSRLVPNTSHPVINHYNSNPDTFWTNLVLRFLHFADIARRHDEGKEYNWLWKQRTVFDTLNKAQPKFDNPSKHLAVDTLNVKFKGRLIFRQYIAKKRNLTASKFTNSEMNQGTHMIWECTWVKTHTPLLMTWLQHTQLLDIWLYRVEGLGHKIFMDNVVSSPRFFMWLSQM